MGSTLERLRSEIAISAVDLLGEKKKGKGGQEVRLPRIPRQACITDPVFRKKFGDVLHAALTPPPGKCLRAPFAKVAEDEDLVRNLTALIAIVSLPSKVAVQLDRHHAKALLKALWEHPLDAALDEMLIKGIKGLLPYRAVINERKSGDEKDYYIDAFDWVENIFRSLGSYLQERVDRCVVHIVRQDTWSNARAREWTERKLKLCDEWSARIHKEASNPSPSYPIKVFQLLHQVDGDGSHNPDQVKLTVEALLRRVHHIHHIAITDSFLRRLPGAKFIDWKRPLAAFGGERTPEKCFAEACFWLSGRVLQRPMMASLIADGCRAAMGGKQHLQASPERMRAAYDLLLKLFIEQQDNPRRRRLDVDVKNVICTHFEIF